MSKVPPYVFHLLPNAHLDPVWLWDWREGLSEGLTTVTTILNLLDEYPDLTFIRGEASIYQHIQKTSPKVFDRILRQVEAGRWDVVGGTHVQPDSNLSSAETLCRQFETALAYFDKEIGVRPRIGWQADSFGHTAGWPNILRSFGMEGFTFTRPQRSEFPMDSPAFWWDCDHDDRLLCYRQHYKWYCSERSNMHKVLDRTLAGARTQSFRNAGVLMGLGNHGGGPTRRHLADIAEWGKSHPEVELRYSTLHGFFDALRAEIARPTGPKIPSFHGELGYCLRGCYSSVQKFKSLFRTAEAGVAAAEISQAVIGSQLGAPLSESLDEAWLSILFNSFHDILPGSSIERAMDDQMAWVGMAIHRGQRAQFEALNALAAQVDTRVPAAPGPDLPCDAPILLWNPSPHAFKGQVEVEAPLDYRPIWTYQHRAGELPFHVRDEKGKLLPFQEIATEHSSMADVPWRKRAVVGVEIPAFGWRVVRMGLAAKKPSASEPGACSATTGRRAPSITNGEWSVSAVRGRVSIARGGKNFLLANQSLRLLVMEDPWGAWGGMNEEPDSYKLDRKREEWKVIASEIIETGPERATLWTRWGGAHSWADLTFSVSRGIPGVSVKGRLLWNERSARLQLVIPSTGDAECDVPGSVVTRTVRGQVPLGRWFQRTNGGGAMVGLASDVLSDADFLTKETRLTLARATRYADDQKTTRSEKMWLPATDCGELKFRLGFYSTGATGDAAASTLTTPPVTLPVTPGAGTLPARGSLGSIAPAGVRLLSAQLTAEGLRLRLQNRRAKPCEATLQLGSKKHSLGRIGSQEIVTRLIRSSAKKATPRRSSR